MGVAVVVATVALVGFDVVLPGFVAVGLGGVSPGVRMMVATGVDSAPGAKGTKGAVVAVERFGALVVLGEVGGAAGEVSNGAGAGVAEGDEAEGDEEALMENGAPALTGFTRTVGSGPLLGVVGVVRVVGVGVVALVVGTAVVGGSVARVVEGTEDGDVVRDGFVLVDGIVAIVGTGAV